MKRAGLKWFAAIAVSLALHASAAVLLDRPSDEVEIAGGTSVEVAMLGNAFQNQAAAGETVSGSATTAEPVTAEEPLKPVQADSSVEAQPVQRVQPVAPQKQSSSAAMSARAPDAEAASPAPPATQNAAISLETAEAASTATPDRVSAAEAEQAAPAETEAVSGEDLSEVASAIAMLDEVPLPTPRPEPPRVEKRTARAEPPRRQAGSGGRQNADTRQGVSGGSASGRSALGNSNASRAGRQAGNAALSNYPGKVASKLRRALRYPREARRSRLQGEVHVSFVVSGNGHVGSVRVVRSSGAEVLDRAAVEAVQRAAPFPPIPPAAGRTSWPFTVPLAFTR